jgi:hypothetical protein
MPFQIINTIFVIMVIICPTSAKLNGLAAGAVEE